MEKRLSVVIPAYNEAEIIRHSVDVIASTLHHAGIPFELVLVDDGSRDGTWDILRALAAERADVRALRFSRNFGKEGAIFAGLDAATGDCVAVMDCDLQHPPAVLVEMYRLWERCGMEVVEAVKASRGKESVLSRFFANAFYGILHWLSGINLKNTSDFRLMDRKVVDVIRAMPERNTFFRGMSTWVGYQRGTVLFDVPPREGGKTKWSRWGLCKLAVSAITSYSSAPLHIVFVSGLLFLLFGVILGVHTLYMKLSGQALSGFTTVILLILLTGSILMLGMGVIGSYVSKIYEEIKGRPRYIVSEQAGGKEERDE